jgi:2-haloacid dehalogenase
VFDAYGTLFDVHSVQALAESFFPGKGAALSAAWRTKQLEYTWLRSLMGRYEDFSRVTLSALEWTFESLGIEPEDAQRLALIEEYRRLAMFPEVPAVLEALAARKPLAILSNGHPDMLNAVVEFNGLKERFRGGVLSVHSARAFKPASAVYRIAEESLGVPRTMMGFVSSNGWDAAGAKTFGFQVFWVNRGGTAVERLGVRPDETLKSLAELPALIP